ncbi:MAG: 5'/3'-nucleotidase SurE [Phycisphaeraceae bacterium]|nr:5'/3'-nucleotidase SurE [Phycisphaeraceae bacterium]
MKILLTNDDGIEAAGLHAAYDAIKDLGEVHVVAPARVQSATSHAITLHRPMVVTPYECDKFKGFAVDGRPADCVKLALAELVGPVDLVISGINHGANVGINVQYSGTVGAAREAAFQGVPAIALSLHLGDKTQDHYIRAAGHARRAIDTALQAGIDQGVLVNINVPILDAGAEPVGIKAVPLNVSPMHDRFNKAADDEGNTTYQAQDSMAFSDRGEATDVDTLYAKYITLTPLHYEQTDTAALDRLRAPLD